MKPVSNPLLRVLAVTNTWPTGGHYRGIFVKEQVEALRRLGVHIDVEVIAQHRGRRDYLLAIWRVRRRALTGRYDLIHIHHGLAALAARFAGPTPRVLTLYGHDVLWHWQRWFTALGCGGVAARIYVSRRMATAPGQPGGPVIPDGVDLDTFTPADRDAARTILGLPREDVVILFGGDPRNWVKGYDVFTEVLDVVGERGMPVRELILAEPGLARHDIARKFAAADVLLFTSRQGFEGSPSVVKEACAMGLPVVSTDVGDVGEILENVTPSAVVKFPGTKDQLIRQLAQHTIEIVTQRRRSNGPDHISWLSLNAIATRVLEVYHDTTLPTQPRPPVPHPQVSIT
ncbi:MAG TPA: glycosyltransferase family 4 protein [Candidatus Limnocylindrales bacterium]|nr:glycosyltransferase family 4 protein [Candidatus Limnocylindrales bacterium]